MKRILAAQFLAVILASFPNTSRAYLLSGTGGAPTDPVFLGPTTIDFDSGPVGLFASTVIANVKFAGLDGPLDISPNYITQFNTLGVNSLQSGQVFNPIKPNQIQFTFTIPVAAMAFNWGAADNTWQMDAYDSSNVLLESHLITLPFSGTNLGEYFGVANGDIKRVVLLDQLDNYPLGDHVFIDNFTYSYETAPEPSTAALLFAAGSLRCISRRPRSSSILAS